MASALPAVRVDAVLPDIPSLLISRSAEGSTFVEWSGRYSADATAGESSTSWTLAVPTNSHSEVIEDGHVKRREALEDLAKTGK